MYPARALGLLVCRSTRADWFAYEVPSRSCPSTPRPDRSFGGRRASGACKPRQRIALRVSRWRELTVIGDHAVLSARPPQHARQTPVSGVWASWLATLSQPHGRVAAEADFLESPAERLWSARPPMLCDGHTCAGPRVRHEATRRATSAARSQGDAEVPRSRPGPFGGSALPGSWELCLSRALALRASPHDGSEVLERALRLRCSVLCEQRELAFGNLL